MLLAILLLKGGCKRCYLNWIKRHTEKPDFYILLLNTAYQKTKIQIQSKSVFKKKKKQLTLIKRPIKFHKLNENFYS